MNRLSFLLVIFLFLIPARGQSVARSKLIAPETLVSESTTPTTISGDLVVAVRAITALKRLDRDVIVYHSLGEFEDDGRLARVSFETFASDLQAVTTEVEPMLSRLPQSRLKTEITNALDSYRDGAFWWQKIYHHPRVVHVSALTSTELTRTSSDTAFLSTVPYTVAIHWRQAGKHLKRAEEMMNGTRK
jgi:hypothetical protein